MIQMNWHNLFFASLPLNIILMTGFVVLVAGLFCRGKAGLNLLLILSLLGISASFASTLYLWGLNFSAEMALLSVDSFAYFFYALLLILTFLACLSFSAYFSKQNNLYPEVYSLTLFSLSGMMVMISTTHLLLFFLGLEVMSLGIYALVGIKRRDARSNEAALKYFILGAMVAGFFLFGTSLLYGVTGSFDVKHFAAAHKMSSQVLLFKVGIILVLVTFAFKVAAVPFHFWAPDVYEGAPLPVTGWMATAVKAAAFAAFIRFLQAFNALDWWDITILIAILSLTTMVIGNLLALYQTNIKRMLAYSSIAHAGYILLALTALFSGSKIHSNILAAPLFYLFAYSIVTLGAFAVASMIASSQDDHAELSAYAGLSKRAPFLAATMTVFMLALTGIPPTVGFSGKFYIFREALDQNLTFLVIVALVMSAVSAYYYLRVIVAMYFVKETAGASSLSKPKCDPALAFVVLLCALATLYFGLLPSSYFEFIRNSVRLLP